MKLHTLCITSIPNDSVNSGKIVTVIHKIPSKEIISHRGILVLEYLKIWIEVATTDVYEVHCDSALTIWTNQSGKELEKRVFTAPIDSKYLIPLQSDDGKEFEGYSEIEIKNQKFLRVKIAKITLGEPRLTCKDWLILKEKMQKYIQDGK